MLWRVYDFETNVSWNPFSCGVAKKCNDIMRRQCSVVKQTTEYKGKQPHEYNVDGVKQWDAKW